MSHTLYKLLQSFLITFMHFISCSLYYFQEGKVASYQGLTDSSNSAGVDTAYRIVADHLRMATVAIADGLLPGREDLE